MMRDYLLVIGSAILLIISIAKGAPPACPPGHLGGISESERRIRMEQWETAIDQLPEADRPGRRQKLEVESGLSATDIENCRKGVKHKKKRPFEED